MDIKTETSIKTLKAHKADLLKAYHKAAAEVDERIDEIRKARGTKIKTHEWTDDDVRNFWIAEGRGRTYEHGMN